MLGQVGGSQLGFNQISAPDQSASESTSEVDWLFLSLI